MAKLARAVFVRDPDKHQDILLRKGETPAAKYAALVTNPACWEGGKLPAAAKKNLASGIKDSGQGNDDGPDDASGGDPGDSGATDTPPEDETPTGDDSEDTKPAARKTAARKPARGRTAADEGTGGQ